MTGNQKSRIYPDETERGNALSQSVKSKLRIGRTLGRKYPLLFCYHTLSGILNNQKELKAWFCNAIWQLACLLPTSLYVPTQTLFNTDLEDISVCCSAPPLPVNRNVNIKTLHVPSSYLTK